MRGDRQKLPGENKDEVANVSSEIMDEKVRVAIESTKGILLSANSPNGIDLIKKYKNLLEQTNAEMGDFEIEDGVEHQKVIETIKEQFSLGFFHLYNFDALIGYDQYEKLMNCVDAYIRTPSDMTRAAFSNQLYQMGLEINEQNVIDGVAKNKEGKEERMEVEKDKNEDVGKEEKKDHIVDQIVSPVEESPVIEKKEAIGSRAVKKCVEGIQDLQDKLREPDKKNAALKIQSYILLTMDQDVSTVSKSIMDQYKLDRYGSSAHVLSSKDSDLARFIPALIREVRRKIVAKDGDETIREFITEAVISFNQEKVDYELWMSGMDKREEELESSIRTAVAKATLIQTNQHRKDLGEIKDKLNSSQEKVTRLQDNLDSREKLINRLEIEKKAAERLNEDQADQIKNMEEQVQAKDKQHADEIKKKNLELQKKQQTIETLTANITEGRPEKVKKVSNSSQDPELLSKIAQLEQQLKAAESKFEEQERVLRSLSTQQVSPGDVKRTTLADEKLREENEILRHQLRELQAATAKVPEKQIISEPPVLISQSTSVPFPSVDSLSSIIIALGTVESSLRGKLESKESKESFSMIPGLIEKLTAMQSKGEVTSKEIINITNECADVISTLKQGSILPLPDKSVSHAGFVNWIQQAAIQIQTQERNLLPSTVSSENLREMQDLAYCIDRIILPTLMLEVSNAHNAVDQRTFQNKLKAFNETDKVYQDLYAGKVNPKELANVQKYVRTFLKDYCLSFINDTHQNRADRSLIQDMSANYNALVSEPKTVRLRSISDDIEVTASKARAKDAKSVAKNDSHFTPQDFSKIFAALQVEEMEKNGWKIDNKKLKLNKAKLDKGILTEFMVPLMLENPQKPRRLLWSNKEAVELKFSKGPDGSIEITYPSKGPNAQALAKRVREGIADPKKTRDRIDESNNRESKSAQRRK